MTSSWLVVPKFTPAAARLADGHYSRRTIGWQAIGRSADGRKTLLHKPAIGRFVDHSQPAPLTLFDESVA